MRSSTWWTCCSLAGVLSLSSERASAYFLFDPDDLPSIYEGAELPPEWSDPSCSLDFLGSHRSQEGREEWRGMLWLSIPLSGCVTRPEVDAQPESDGESEFSREGEAPWDPAWGVEPVVLRWPGSREARIPAGTSRGLTQHLPPVGSVPAPPEPPPRAPQEPKGEGIVTPEGASVQQSPGGSSLATPAAEQVEAERRRETARRLAEQDFIAELVRRAQLVSGLLEGLERNEALHSRARWSGLLPELRLRGVQGFDESRSYEAMGLVTTESVTKGQSDRLLELRLTFHLENLLFESSQAGLERTRIQLKKELFELGEKVIALYAEWKLLAEREEQLASSLEPLKLLELELRRQSLALQLHFLTGGYFPLNRSREEPELEGQRN